MTRADLRLQAGMVLATIVLFLLLFAINTWLFPALEFGPGINYIYLPSGARLLCILLFGEAGALGLLLVSWLVCFGYLFPHDPLRSFVGGAVSAAAPWLANLADRHLFGLRPSLSNLSARRLLMCVLTYSLVSPALHHLYFWLHGDPTSPHSLVAMMIGDLNGALLVVYAAKGLLHVLAPNLPAPPSR